VIKDNVDYAYGSLGLDNDGNNAGLGEVYTGTD